MFSEPPPLRYTVIFTPLPGTIWLWIQAGGIGSRIRPFHVDRPLCSSADSTCHRHQAHPPVNGRVQIITPENHPLPHFQEYDGHAAVLAERKLLLPGDTGVFNENAQSLGREGIGSPFIMESIRLSTSGRREKMASYISFFMASSIGRFQSRAILSCRLLWLHLVFCFTIKFLAETFPIFIAGQ
jgi:hypothetical protein